MDYELAKQLKDAGFPQGLTEHQYGWVEAHECFELDNGDMTIGVSAPTLEELIEACGVQFGALMKRDREEDDPDAFPSDWEFGAASRRFENLQTFGSTPTEAVARLWLALQPNGHATMSSGSTNRPSQPH